MRGGEGERGRKDGDGVNIGITEGGLEKRKQVEREIRPGHPVRTHAHSHTPDPASPQYPRV